MSINRSSTAICVRLYYVFTRVQEPVWGLCAESVLDMGCTVKCLEVRVLFDLRVFYRSVKCYIVYLL